MDVVCMTTSSLSERRSDCGAPARLARRRGCGRVRFFLQWQRCHNYRGDEGGEVSRRTGSQALSGLWGESPRGRSLYCRRMAQQPGLCLFGCQGQGNQLTQGSQREKGLCPGARWHRYPLYPGAVSSGGPRCGSNGSVVGQGLSLTAVSTAAFRFRRGRCGDDYFGRCCRNGQGGLSAPGGSLQSLSQWLCSEGHGCNGGCGAR